MAPFHIHYSLSRRQRLVNELSPWIPAIAGLIGFVCGAIYLAAVVSPWFLLLFVIPAVVYRGLFAFAFDVIVHPKQPVNVLVDDSRIEVRIDGKCRSLPLDGIIQVFRSEDGATWTVLHIDRSVFTIPASAITGEQLDYLKSFALQAARERKAAESQS